MVGALAYAGCSVLTSGVLDDKGPTPSGPGGGGGGGMAPTVTCAIADECPGLDTTCRYRVCEEGICGFDDAPSGVGCSENEGTFCNGEGACVQCLGNEDCTGDDSCVGGVCAPVHCTDQQRNMGETDTDCGGPCPPCDNGEGCATADDCASQFCKAGTCTACSNDGDCAASPGTYCDTGICIPQKGKGDQCTGDAQCVSGACADDVCCDAPCTECDGCRLGLTGVENGTCAPILDGQDPHAFCDEDGTVCGHTGTCDGASDCAFSPTSQICSTAGCSGGVQTFDGSCDGQGTCGAMAPMMCGAYACNGNVCHTSCTSAAQCSGSGICIAGHCHACGTGTAPAGGSCPAICDSCNAGLCLISCVGGASGKCDGGVTCPPGWDCKVDCVDAQSCQNDTIDCPNDGHACDVQCIPSGGNQSCQGATINCGDGPCALTCGGDQGCSGTTFNCGTNSCTPNCNNYDVTVNNSGASCMYNPSGC